MRSVLLLFVCCLSFAFGTAQGQTAPKREFRAAWIATVANIDWPSKPGLPAVQQQQEFIQRLDMLRSLGCNAVIVQIRPSADAFYPSQLEPWSRYLTGKQGQAPFPSYDPLSFMIEETHKRNMEFHAWFNPFRALTDSKKNPNPAAHVTLQHPDWVISYGGKSYLDPGLPEAREYVINVIMDVVKRYDIDAVHLDDYFYPYRIAGLEFGDNKSYLRFKDAFKNKDDWRRNNVNLFVTTLNNNIKSVKRYVKFGISPFGVWRNASKDPQGSETRGGQTCYDDLYADVLEWLRRGWIDYALPQLYWERGHRAAAFEVLLPWWEEHSYRRHVYYGLGLYRMIDGKGVWAGTKEILGQISDIRRDAAHPGISLYSASNFDKLGKAIRDSLQQEYFATYAFPPAMPWLDSIPPPAPVLKIAAQSNGTQLQWKTSYTGKDALTYAVYRFFDNEPVNLNKSERIISVQKDTEYFDKEAKYLKNPVYVVTALDRLWNESKPSNTAGND
jgi:uncharacterized lipoprotein YddW (UPF0748 family)